MVDSFNCSPRLGRWSLRHLSCPAPRQVSLKGGHIAYDRHSNIQPAKNKVQINKLSFQQAVSNCRNASYLLLFLTLFLEGAVVSIAEKSAEASGLDGRGVSTPSCFISSLATRCRLLQNTIHWFYTDIMHGSRFFVFFFNLKKENNNTAVFLSVFWKHFKIFHLWDKI